MKINTVITFSKEEKETYTNFISLMETICDTVNDKTVINRAQAIIDDAEELLLYFDD